MYVTRRPTTALFIGMALVAGAGCAEVSVVLLPDAGDPADGALDAEILLDAEVPLDAWALLDGSQSPDASLDAGPSDGGPACAVDETLCDDLCVDLAEDPHHCGGCEVDCDALPGVAPGASRCSAGRCEITDACAPGRADCGGGAADGCETDATTADDCGACGRACVAGVEVCSADVHGDYGCATSCSGGTPDRCGDACVDTSSSPAHCGGCGIACPGAPFGAAVCDAGTCELACDAGYHRCESACAPSGAVTSCGSACTPCPVPAGATATCDGVACGYACLPGFADCDGDPSNGCEADLASPTSCGACARDCTALPGVLAGAVRCSAGACDVTDACAPGRADCTGGALDGCEADLTSEVTCGACGVACDGSSETCEPAATGGHACTNGCDASAPTRCGDACVDLASSVTHCGECGTSCPSPPGGSAVCGGGTCDFACNAGSHRCGDACVPSDSVDSCGGSCTPCAVPPNAVATCDGSACGFACSPGFADCDGDAENGCELSLSDPEASVLFCEGFERGLGAWSVGANWGTNTTAYRGTYSLRGYWGGTTAGCGITRSTYLAHDLDLSEARGAALEYRHRAIVGSSDNLYVLASTDGGATWAVIDRPRSSGGWSLRRVDLAAYAGVPALRIGFRFHNVCGDADGVTWWIDDVAVTR